MLVPVISGGAGTRLWPVSREAAQASLTSLPARRVPFVAKDLLSLPPQHWRSRGATFSSRCTNRNYFFQSKDHFHGC